MLRMYMRTAKKEENDGIEAMWGVSELQNSQVADNQEKPEPRVKLHNRVEALTTFEEDQEELVQESQEPTAESWQTVRTKRRVRKAECGEIRKVDEHDETHDVLQVGGNPGMVQRDHLVAATGFWKWAWNEFLGQA